MFVLNVIVYLLLKFINASEGSFSTVPESVIQAEGLNATFTCSHPTAIATGWTLNGTSVNIRHPPNVITGTTSGGDHYLTIVATPNYNKTTVQCFAYVMNGERLNTTTVLLLVQGVLNSVYSITIVPDTAQIIIAWKPPFSLNLSHAEPDVVYCIDVYNVTNQSYYDHLFSDCSIISTQYTFNVSHPDPRDTFEFIITARSNIVGAENGTPSEPMQAYFYVDPIVCASDIRIEIGDKDLEIIPDFPNWAGKVNITVYLWTYDDAEAIVNCECVIVPRLTASNNCSDCTSIIKRNRKYMVKVHCANDLGTGESDTHYLSTHEIVNGTFIVDGDRLHFTCNFVTNSKASGCFLVISQSTTVGTITQQNSSYRAVYRNSMTDLAVSSTHQNLASGRNRVFLYELEKTGLPGRFPAVNTSVVIESDPQVTDVSNVMLKCINNLTLFTALEQVCVSHSLQASYLGCTILFHPCSHEWAGDFTSVNYINARMQTVCFSLSNGCYIVTVFFIERDGVMDSLPAITDVFMIKNAGSGAPNGTFLDTQKSISVNNVLIITLGSLLFICILVIIFVMGLWILKWCKRRKRTDSQLSVASSRLEATQSDYDVAIHLHKCEAYETVGVSTARSQPV